MKRLIQLCCAIALYSPGVFAQTVNGIPSQSLTAIPNASLSNSSTTLNGACGLSAPGAVSLGASGTVQLSQTVNAQTGTSYTVVSADCGKLVTFSNASAIAVTLPQATGSFAAGFVWEAENLGVGTVTITPTTSTINGAATFTLATNNGSRIFSDGTNWQVELGKSTAAAGVTSVGLSAPASIFSVGGSPVTTTGTLALSFATGQTAHQVIGTCGAATTVALCALATGDLPVVVAPGVSTVSFSATPVFDLSLGNMQKITLTGNVTSFTISNLVAGQMVLFDFIQDATGSRTVSSPPAAIHGLFTIGSTASKHNVQEFYSPDGTNLYAKSPGVINQ